MTGSGTFLTSGARLRAIFEHIEPKSQLSWKLFVRQASHFRFAWHFHHEFELTLITRGTGTRFVGDCVEEYGPGDLTLIGPELPHTYQSALGDGDHEAMVVQFRRDFLGAGFFGHAEFAGVAALLERAARGLSFPPTTWNWTGSARYRRPSGPSD